MSEQQTPCIPARMVRAQGERKIGDYCVTRQGRQQARNELIKREGPPPFPGAICRHLCKNDSMAPNGFICTLHTTWGTVQENTMDQSPETRERMRALGRIRGRTNVESGQFRKAALIGNNSPNNPYKLRVTCPHCGKTGNKVNMLRWHLDNCKYKP